jgi:hypothetical protein
MTAALLGSGTSRACAGPIEPRGPEAGSAHHNASNHRTEGFR